MFPFEPSENKKTCINAKKLQADSEVKQTDNNRKKKSILIILENKPTFSVLVKYGHK